MSKNIMIGAFVVIVLAGLGFYFFRSNSDDVTAPVDNTAPADVTTAPPVTDNTAPALKPDAPIVQTSQTNSTSSSTAYLAGTVKPNGASTTYWFEYGETTSFGKQSSAQAIGSGYSAITATGFITGLKANTLYYYRLSAKNKFATVNGAMYTLQTNSTPPPKVVATTVHTASATDITRTSATINGQVNPNGTATSYWYEYGTDTNFGFVTQYLGTNSGSSFISVPASISGLQPLTKYYYRLNAQNQFGTVNGTTTSFTTQGPAAASKPSVVTQNAKSISSTDAIFTGSINPNGADTTYWFEYSTDSLLGSLIGSGTTQGLASGTTTRPVQINVNGLQSNTKYYYHLVGRNSLGTVYGNIVSFTTKK